jgi:hypothetical protein
MTKSKTRKIYWKKRKEKREKHRMKQFINKGFR